MFNQNLITQNGTFKLPDLDQILRPGEKKKQQVLCLYIPDTVADLSAHKFNCFFEPLISSSATILNAFAIPALCSSSVSFPAFQNCDEGISWIWNLIKNEAE